MIKLFNMNDVSIIGWGITITIAVVGWGIAIIQALKNRNLQKEIEVKKLRHDAYRTFIMEMDAVSKEIGMMPITSIKSIMSKCSADLIRIDIGALDSKEQEARCVEDMFNELWGSLENMLKPIKHISQAIAALDLDATDELRPMLWELKDVFLCIDNEWQQALMTTSKDEEGLEQLAELSKSQKWDRYQVLYNKILQQMRKECNI